MLKDYSIGLGNYITDVFSNLSIKAIESKKDTAFEEYAKYNNQRKLSLPFISYKMTGDVELDTIRYNAYIHRVGFVNYTDTTTKLVMRTRAIPITHPYTIEFWSPNKDKIGTMRRTFWIAIMDNPIVLVFNRSVDMTYRVSLDVESSVSESVVSVEERSGYFNSTINVRLGVWIRMPRETQAITKAIIEYIESPTGYVLSVDEYS